MTQGNLTERSELPHSIMGKRLYLSATVAALPRGKCFLLVNKCQLIN